MTDNISKQYQYLLFWRTVFLITSIVILVLSLFIDWFIWLFLVNAVIVIMLSFLKNKCPFCHQYFFMYKSQSLLIDTTSIFGKHCVNCGEPKH